MEIINYVVEQAFIVIPVLWVLGTLLKGTPKVQDWYIPWVLLVVGTGLTVAILGPGADAVIQGILVTGVAVLGNQLVKQTLKK